MCARTEVAAKDTTDAEVSMINQQCDESIHNLTKMTSDSYFPSTFKSQGNLLLYSGKDCLGKQTMVCILAFTSHLYVLCMQQLSSSEYILNSACYFIRILLLQI